jgi:hypothetical protein
MGKHHNTAGQANEHPVGDAAQTKKRRLVNEAALYLLQTDGTPLVGNSDNVVGANEASNSSAEEDSILQTEVPKVTFHED